MTTTENQTEVMLTVRQPWASAMFARVNPKGIENRTWDTARRERVGIHAALRIDRAGLAALRVPEPPATLLGVVLGTVEITSTHEAGSRVCAWHECQANPWAQWPTAEIPTVWHWELEHPREFVTPIRSRGALGFWRPGPSVEALVRIAEIAP